MNTKNLLCLVATCALASSGAAQTQSLPEVAKAEKARREKIKATGGGAKLYTEGDRSGEATETGAEGKTAGDPTAPAAAPAKKGKEKTSEEIAAAKQTEWNDKVKKAQDELKAVEDRISKNERILASMYNITPARADIVNTIEADKKQLATLQKALVDLEDQRRRAGMPRPR